MLFNKKIGPEDANQGYLGNCYLISSITGLALVEDRVRKLFGQSDISRGEGTAIRYCVNGTFETVLVDDHVPVDPSQQKMMKFCSSAKNCFWPILLEKASAKVYGGYCNLIGSSAVYALKDLTGAPAE